MNDLATHLSGFLREHLPAERNASQHTCETYAYSFQLLVEFAAGRMKCKPSQLTLGQIDASMIMAFLEHIETKRGNCARTRNARLAAIKSFFRYLEYRLPAYLDQSRQIHAIPMKKTDQMLIDYRRTCCAIHVPCTPCRPRVMFARSHFGWGMPACKVPRCISVLIQPKNWKHWQAVRHLGCSVGVSEPPIS